jgi:hypothetical protein
MPLQPEAIQNAWALKTKRPIRARYSVGAARIHLLTLPNLDAEHTCKTFVWHADTAAF